MRNKFILLVTFSFLILSVFAQKNTAQLISSNEGETVLTFKMDSYDFKDVKTPNGIEKIIVSENTSEILEKGFPSLLKFTESIIISDIGNTKIDIISSDYYEIQDISIAPSKGNFTRDIDPSTVPFEYGKVYTKDEFFPKQNASLENPYIARDYRGQAVHVYPFTYNPIQKTLRVYTEITVKISTLKEKGVNEFNRNKAFTKIDREFMNIYSSHFINYSNSKYTPVEEEGNMLIICYDDWTTEMQALVDWKNTIGRPCEMVTVTEAGGTYSSIATYVENYYNNNGLTYLLLVGDNAQVPTIPGPLSAGSDNSYAYISGSDHYLEFFVGRFSAENAAHVETQVQRTIEYENGSTLTDGWLNRTMGIASDDPGSGDDGEFDYEHYRNMATDLLNFTYSESSEFFEGSQGGNDASGNPTSTMVGEDVNNGVGIINYTGHGSEMIWVTSGFSTTDVDNLTNDNKLPFIFDVACVNGAFRNITCFAEYWLRAENNGEPTGAIAICASTINQSWAPPMCAQDEMVDLIAGTSTNGIKRTFSGIAVNGMFQMNDEYSDYDMTDTWTTFGDPSVLIRTDNTSEMVISHDDVVIVGSSNFDVSCDLDGALACISLDGVIVGTASVSGGTTSVPVPGVTPGQTLTLAVTGFNKVTYITNLNVIAPTGPYLIVDSYVNEVNYGQSVDLDIILENVGQDDASGVSVTISTADANAIISNADYTYGSISAGTTSSISSGAFTLSVDNDLEDQYTIVVNIAITDGAKLLWESTKNVTVNAPVLTIGELTIDDSAGNNDGILDPGETADIIIETSNSGHADVTNVISTISSLSPDLTLNSTTTVPTTLGTGQSENFIFNLTADAGTPIGTPADIDYEITAGVDAQYNALESKQIVIGLIPEFNISSGGSITTCVGLFTDSGGETGEYQNGENFTMTFYPASSGSVMEANFISFDVESQSSCSYDALKIYDGTSTNASLVGTFCGTTSPGLITATNTDGALTFVFTSDVSVTNPGWLAEISCLSIETPSGVLSGSGSPICAGSSTGTITLINNSAIITSWEKSQDGGSWETIANTSNTYSETISTGCTMEYRAVLDDGAYYSNVVSVTAFDNPIADYTYTANNQEVTFTNTSSESTSYSWDFGYGFTSTLENPVYTFPSSGTYSVVLTASNGVCEDSELSQDITVSYVGISQIESNISIIPNPNNGLFTIDLGNLNLSETSVNIYTVSGQEIFKSNANTNTLELNLTNYAKGIYFVKIISGNEAFNSKIILK